VIYEESDGHDWGSESDIQGLVRQALQWRKAATSPLFAMAIVWQNMLGGRRVHWRPRQALVRWCKLLPWYLQISPDIARLANDRPCRGEKAPLFTALGPSVDGEKLSMAMWQSNEIQGDGTRRKRAKLLSSCLAAASQSAPFQSGWRFPHPAA
jgi:hypothetical protein